MIYSISMEVYGKKLTIIKYFIVYWNYFLIFLERGRNFKNMSITSYSIPSNTIHSCLYTSSISIHLTIGHQSPSPPSVNSKMNNSIHSKREFTYAWLAQTLPASGKRPPNHSKTNHFLLSTVLLCSFISQISNHRENIPYDKRKSQSKLFMWSLWSAATAGNTWSRSHCLVIAHLWSVQVSNCIWESSRCAVTNFQLPARES